LLYCSLERLGLEFEAERREPREQHVVLADPPAAKARLHGRHLVH